MTIITINNNCINKLDLSPATEIIERCLNDGTIVSLENHLRFEINYEREEFDPRELSEISEVRQWFIRLDAKYPWLPFLLDWKQGEFARYTSMLVPHQFSKKEGIQFNLEALEIFLMHKVFVLTEWLKQQNIPSVARIKSMAQLLGYDLDDALFEVLNNS